MRGLALPAAAVLALGSAVSAEVRPIVISLDAREAPRKILHAKLLIPARGGSMTLVYPKWIPGTHSPAGMIADLTGLHFSADGVSLNWQRDSVDMYAFHLNVPAGGVAIEAALDFVLPPGVAEGQRGTASATTQLAVLDWSTVVLYPQGVRPTEQTVVARLWLPPGWSYATALPLSKTSGDALDFEPVPLSTLVDSPVLSGAHFRSLDLSPGDTSGVFLHLAAESETALDAPPAFVDAMRRLPGEALALFGGRHYRSYHFLYALSDQVDHFGLEHHESSDDRSPERTLVDPTLLRSSAGLLTHEMVHSWNGKYRRPAGLATTDYQQPMKGDLLWVYEGLTEYLGDVLAVRAGLVPSGIFRENLARLGAQFDHTPGRDWRSLLDTAVSAQALYDARKDWASLRRSTDFYDEGELLWLDADVTIRQRSEGSKSLDDFCRAFFGGESGPPTVNPYGLDDVLQALNRVAPYDWKTFLSARVDQPSAHPPLAGIEGGGWKLTYSDAPGELDRGDEYIKRTLDLRYSVGVRLRDDGVLEDVLPGMPAATAGLSPGMRIVAVSGRKFSFQVLRDALKAAKGRTEAIVLLVEANDFFESHSLEYHDGERYPRLERDDAHPDLLELIVKPLTGSHS